MVIILEGSKKVPEFLIHQAFSQNAMCDLQKRKTLPSALMRLPW